VLTESEDTHGLGYAVTLTKRASRNPRQLWIFGTDGTIAPLSSPTKYLTFHQAGSASGGPGSEESLYVNISASVTVTPLLVHAVVEDAAHVSVHLSAPVASNAHPAECDTHVLAMVHTSETMAKVISALRSSVVALTEQCHARGIDVNLATFDDNLRSCELVATDDWRASVRRHVRVGSGTDYMRPCEHLVKYLRESKDNLDHGR
jgi:hypothetical protein